MHGPLYAPNKAMRVDQSRTDLLSMKQYHHQLDLICGETSHHQTLPSSVSPRYITQNAHPPHPPTPPLPNPPPPPSLQHHRSQLKHRPNDTNRPASRRARSSATDLYGGHDVQIRDRNFLRVSRKQANILVQHHGVRERGILRVRDAPDAGARKRESAAC